MAEYLRSSRDRRRARRREGGPSSILRKRVCIIERAPKPGGAAVEHRHRSPRRRCAKPRSISPASARRGLYGVDYSVKRDITIADFMFRERSVVESEWKLIDENIKRHEITQMQGTARFVDPQTIEVTRVGDRRRGAISAQVFLIATGLATAAARQDIAVDGTVIVDSDSLLTLDRIPGLDDRGRRRRDRLRIRVHLRRARRARHDRERANAGCSPTSITESSDALRQQMTSRLGISVHVDTEMSDIAVSNTGARVVTLGDRRDLRRLRAVLRRSQRRLRRASASKHIGVSHQRRADTSSSTISISTAVPASTPPATSSASRRSRPRRWSRHASRCVTRSSCGTSRLSQRHSVRRLHDSRDRHRRDQRGGAARARTSTIECGRVVLSHQSARGQIIGDLDGS